MYRVFCTMPRYRDNVYAKDVNEFEKKIHTWAYYKGRFSFLANDSLKKKVLFTLQPNNYPLSFLFLYIIISYYWFRNSLVLFRVRFFLVPLFCIKRFHYDNSFLYRSKRPLRIFLLFFCRLCKLAENSKQLGVLRWQI